MLFENQLRGKAVRSRDHLHTILTEIETCLNSRPLTYQSFSQEELTAIRPIDFYQKNLEVTFSLRGKAKTTEDTTYLPPEEARALRTRRDAEEAIQSSCKFTEQFWKVWQHHYLTSLQEQQLRNISRKRLGQETPTVGSIVLISDPVLPRNSWKLARITDIRRGIDGVIREAELVTSNRRKVRRPVNLLIPLEIVDDISETTDKELTSSLNENSKEETLEKPYNLRSRQMSCNVENVVTTTRRRNPRNSRTKWFLFYIMVLTLTTLV
ncbi:unnamed protein product [Cylicocyclus nassatus]|uniref:DUF5641 domain-containing protein n=1 Tax=Cylicocyclus nassatus TaxID=53992 RepID=A0AA36H4F5_CYLNA|nr:unnamed protein product [Cylicocyclus nassatus]